LELIESIETLKGETLKREGARDFADLCIELAAMMLVLGGAADGLDEARARARKLIESGAALEKFREMIEAQGGDAGIIDDYTLLPGAQQRTELRAPRRGYISVIDTYAVGQAAIELGAGRHRIDSTIDYGVGFDINVKIGDEVEAGQSLCTIYYND